MNHDDIDLARRLAARDEAALAEVYVRFAPSISRWLRRKFACLPPGEIEDIAQEGLLILWKRRADFDLRRANLRSWYCGIACKIALKSMERNRIKGCALEAGCASEVLDRLPWRDDEAPEAVGEGRDEDDNDNGSLSPRGQFRAENLPLMSELLAALSSCERNALLATMAGDYPISRADAAARFGLNPNTFRSHLKRAHDHIISECARRGLPPPNWKIWEGNND